MNSAERDIGRRAPRRYRNASRLPEPRECAEFGGRRRAWCEDEEFGATERRVPVRGLEPGNLRATRLDARVSRRHSPSRDAPFHGFSCRGVTAGHCQSKILNTSRGHRSAYLDSQDLRKIDGRKF